MGNSNGSRQLGYGIRTKTGDKKGSGTNVKIYVTLISEDQRRSHDLHLECKWRNDFEAGNIDTFEFDDVPDIGPIKTIEVRRMAGWWRSEWFLEWIEVINHHRAEDEPDIFPFQRWVKSGVRFTISKYDCVLPQFDEFPGQRLSELERKRNSYVLSEKAAGIPKQVLDLPEDENFSNSYKWNIFSIRSSLILRWKLKTIFSSSWKTVDDVDNIYSGCFAFPKPYGKDMWRLDNNFGRQRLQGCNPISICRCEEIPKNFGVTAEMVEPFLEGRTLEEAMDAKKIYIVDHSFMKGLQCTNSRKVVAPFALFHVNSDGELMPVALQLFPNSQKKQHPVFLPSDPKGVWTLAKIYFNNADASFHQCCTHLGFTHLVIEGFSVVTHRELSPSHPIFRLLAPHFLYLLAINTRALAKLVAPGGWVDTSMTVGAVGLMNIVRKKFVDWRLDVHGWLPNDLKNRGVDDIEALPHYPYRDDALLSHKAIKTYVKEIVHGYYDTPEKLLNDYEIQNWANMLVDEEGLGVQGVPGNGELKSRKHLTKILTCLIFVSSVSHAAANFSQYDDYGFPANYPAFLRGKPPVDKTDVSDDEILQHLPDKDMTLSIAAITKLLSDRGTNCIGNFEKKYMFDPIGEKAHDRLMVELDEISDIIAERNQTRPEIYPYLDPKEIPNSISI